MLKIFVGLIVWGRRKHEHN